jgi:hypothetical protein
MLHHTENFVCHSVPIDNHIVHFDNKPLRSRLTQRNLEALMRISMEGKDKLSDGDLETLVDKFKNTKDR